MGFEADVEYADEAVMEGAQHGFPTDLDVNVNSCDYLGEPGINNCEYDGVGAMFTHLYGDALDPRNIVTDGQDDPYG